MYNKLVLLDMPHFLPHGKCHISPDLEREIKGQKKCRRFCVYRIKLKNMPMIILCNCTEKDRKSIMDKYLEKHKDDEPESVLEFDVPKCFTSAEEQEKHIRAFFNYYTNGDNRLSETDLGDFVRQYNDFIRFAEKYTVPSTVDFYNADTNRYDLAVLTLITGEKSDLLLTTQTIDSAGPRRMLVAQHFRSGRKYNFDEEYSRTYVPEDIDTLVKIHKIMVVYEYAKKKASKLTVKLTKDSVFNLFVNLVEKKFFGENSGYYTNIAFSQEEYGFLSKLVDSLDPQIVKEAYANAEKSAAKINEIQAQVGANV